MLQLNQVKEDKKVKKIIKNICIGYITTIIVSMPVLMLYMYFTYTEKTIAPVLLITLVIAGIVLYEVEK